MTDETSQGASPSPTTDVQRKGGEAQLQQEFHENDQSAGQTILDRPLDGDRTQRRRGIFIDKNAVEGSDPTAEDLFPGHGPTTSTTSTEMTTPTSSTTSTSTNSQQ